MAILNHISAVNYRSLAGVSIEPAPFTIIVGKNGSGKSNILKAVKLITSFLLFHCEFVSDNLTLLDGRPLTFPHKGTFSSSFDGFHLDDIFAGQAGYRSSVSIGTGILDITLSYEATRTSIERTVDIQHIPSPEVFEPGFALSALSDNIFAEDYSIQELETPHFPTPNQDYRLARARRGVPLRMKELASSTDAFMEFRLLCAEICGIDISEVVSRDGSPTYQNGGIFTEFGGRTRKSVDLPLRYASTGTRNVLLNCLLAATLDRRDGSYESLFLEEPEVSLHPSGQVRLGEYFAKRVAEHTRFADLGDIILPQIVLTTHSPYLIHGALKAVRDGILSANDLVVMECERIDPESVQTSVITKTVTPDGFLDGWVKSFTDVDNYLFQGWMKTLGGKSEGST